MLDDQDINKLKSVFATKEDFKNLVTKKDLSDSQDRMLSLLASKQELNEVKNNTEELKELVQGLIISNDSIAKSISDLRLEYAAISTQLTRHERWIKQIAEKVGLNLAME
jgi:protein subunit release factor A